MAKTTHPAVTCGALLTELRGLIDTARQHVAQTANATLTMLYWRIGLRIGVELLQKERAPYGQEIVSAVSRELTLAYGKGFRACSRSPRGCAGAESGGLRCCKSTQ